MSKMTAMIFIYVRKRLRVFLNRCNPIPSLVCCFLNLFLNGKLLQLAVLTN